MARQSRRRILISLAVAALLAAGASTGMVRAQWDPEGQVSAGSGDVWQHGIAATGDVVHLIWGEDPIRYRRSMDEGETWSDDVALVPSGLSVLTDPLVAQGSNVYVVSLRDVWSATDWCCRRSLGNIYLRRSVDGGTTWEPETRLTTARGAHRISLADSGTRLDLVWMDYRSGTWDIYYRRSLDRGRTWEPEVRLVAGGAGFGAERPQVASVGDSVHVVWMDDRDGHPPCYTTPACPEVYYKRSSNGGATWRPDVRLTFDPTFSGRPDVAVLAPATIVVAYDEDSDHHQGHEQYILRSLDGGRSFEPPLRMSSAPGSSEHPSLVTQGQSVHLAWFDKRDGESTAIFYRASLDGGDTWLTEERVTQPDRNATTPLLAVTRNHVHAVWLGGSNRAVHVWYGRRPVHRR